MRLIDSDAFIQYLKDAVKRQKYENLKIDEYLTVADVLNAVISDLDGTSLVGFKNAPTIEPERKGKWIHDNTLKYFFCSECGEPSLTDDDRYIYSMDFPNFCPNCGADMREREQE